MVMRRNDGYTASLDYRERAPLNAFAELYLDANGEIREGLSLDTRLGAGVPGTVYGIYDMHQEFGSFKMKYLMEPAIELARKGFPLTATQALRLNENREKFETRNRSRTAFVKNDLPLGPKGATGVGVRLLECFVHDYK